MGGLLQWFMQMQQQQQMQKQQQLQQQQQAPMPNPDALRDAIHQIWLKHGAATGQPPLSAPPAPTQPQQGYSARFGGLTPLPPQPIRGGPQINPPGGGLNPSSIRVDFHPPPEPPSQ